jgi:hypothetical protein
MPPAASANQTRPAVSANNAPIEAARKSTAVMPFVLGSSDSTLGESPAIHSRSSSPTENAAALDANGNPTVSSCPVRSEYISTRPCV